MDKQKKIFYFVASSLKYEPYKIDNFEKVEKILFFKRNFSLAASTRDFRSTLYALYQWKYLLVNWSYFEGFTIACQARDDMVPVESWNQHWKDRGEWQTLKIYFL